MMANLKLAAPWTIYYEEIKALFSSDPDIQISIDDDEKVVKLYVTGTEKAEALEKLLPAEKVFGNITVRTEVVRPT